MKIKNFTLFLIWAGAAISIAEIYTGSLFAPLGLTKGLLAILIGHIIGTLFFSLGGLMSYILKLPAIKSTKVVLGNKGTIFFRSTKHSTIDWMDSSHDYTISKSF